MIDEIGRRPGGGFQDAGYTSRGAQPSGRHDSTTVGFNREGYALAAGLALGLITLGQGDSLPSLQDLNLPERLRWALRGCFPLGRGLMRRPRPPSASAPESDHLWALRCCLWLCW